jgi:hypothetical protein
MGQTVIIKGSRSMGDVLMLDTDRSFTGQDGHAIPAGSTTDAVPGLLAEGLYGLDIGIDYVYVLQNVVTVRRPAGWDEDTEASVREVVEGFLLHY